MFGFLVGTACLVGLTVMLARGRRRRWSGGFRFGPRYVIGAVLDRLETTPGQEKAIRAAIDEFSETAVRARRDFRASRRELARAVRGESLDSQALHEAFVRHDGSIGELRSAFAGALSKVHETLDERQRETLADMIESGHYDWHRGHAHGC
jgi:uncharacterized membrane protein